METIRDKSFEEIYSHILGEIQRGSVDRKNPFHLCFLSTINNYTGFPESRTVVLRKVDRDSFVLRVHSDTRSEKIKHIKFCHNTHLLFYNQKAKLQVRLKSIGKEVQDEELKKEVWSQAQEISQRCYYVPHSPSTEIKNPFLNSEIDPTDQTLGYNVFSILEFKVFELDVLELNYEGHLRASLKVNNGKLEKSVWLMP
jgi:pyridoxine/pyridoxamine 5'-phosphate oxidase